MYVCKECGQSTKFRTTCNSCADKFMKESDEEMEYQKLPEWGQRVLLLLRYLSPIKNKKAGG